MHLSGAEEHIHGCSFPGRSLPVGKDLKVKRQEKTFGHSYPFLVCWIPVIQYKKNNDRSN